MLSQATITLYLRFGQQPGHKRFRKKYTLSVSVVLLFFPSAVASIVTSMRPSGKTGGNSGIVAVMVFVTDSPESSLSRKGLALPKTTGLPPPSMVMLNQTKTKSFFAVSFVTVTLSTSVSPGYSVDPDGGDDDRSIVTALAVVAPVKKMRHKIAKHDIFLDIFLPPLRLIKTYVFRRRHTRSSKFPFPSNYKEEIIV